MANWIYARFWRCVWDHQSVFPLILLLLSISLFLIYCIVIHILSTINSWISFQLQTDHTLLCFQRLWHTDTMFLWGRRFCGNPALHRIYDCHVPARFLTPHLCVHATSSHAVAEHFPSLCLLWNLGWREWTLILLWKDCDSLRLKGCSEFFSKSLVNYFKLKVS